MNERIAIMLLAVMALGQLWLVWRLAADVGRLERRLDRIEGWRSSTDYHGESLDGAVMTLFDRAAAIESRIARGEERISHLVEAERTGDPWRGGVDPDPAFAVPEYADPAEAAAR